MCAIIPRMYSTTVHSPRQVIHSAQETIDRIVRESPLHTLSQGVFEDATDRVLDRTDVMVATDEPVYDDRELFATIRMYHPRYTTAYVDRPVGSAVRQIWEDLAKDIPYYAGIVRTYLVAIYAHAATHGQVYFEKQRAHLEDTIRLCRIHLAEHHTRIVARAAELSVSSVHHRAEVPAPIVQQVVPVATPATSVLETTLPVFEPLTVERVAVPSSASEPMTPPQETLPTRRDAHSALVDLAPLLVYVRACGLVMSRITKGYSPTHHATPDVHPNELTHKQYTAIIDDGTHSEITRRFPPHGV